MKYWVIGVTAVLSLMAMAPERVAAGARPVAAVVTHP